MADTDTRQTPAHRYLSAGVTSASESAYAARALYYAPPNSFAFTRPAIPVHRFVAERDRAFATDAPTGLIALDLSETLGTPFPCTTPLMLLRYGVIKAGDELTTALTSSGEFGYVISGCGQTVSGNDRITWSQGDAFMLPGGNTTTHTASHDTRLLLVTNEPQLAYEHTQSPVAGHGAFEAVHYPAEEILHQLDALCATGEKRNVTSKAVLLTSRMMRAWRTLTPTITVGFNVFEPGDHQRPHRHNAAAATLCIRAKPGAYSMIDGVRADWEDGLVMITPPQAVHQHHNESDEPVFALVVQDGGLYYHTRATGFAFV